MHKVELKVYMCCPKCAEIVTEEIKYLGGKHRFLILKDGSISFFLLKIAFTNSPFPLVAFKPRRCITFAWRS